MSAVVNALVLAGLVWLAGQREDIEPFIVASSDQERPIEYMVYLVQAPEEEESAAGVGEIIAGGVPEEEDDSPELMAVLPVQPEQAENVVAPPTEVPTEILPLPESTLVATRIGRRRRLRPEYGNGELWIPSELTERDRALIGLAIAEIDSQYRQQLIAAILAIPPDSFARGTPRPWTTEVGGRTWGIDKKFIYLGGIKIPTMLLALLPIPATGNFDQAVAAADYERMRQEIIFQARRQADREQINDYIKELREREDEKRQQREALLAKTDTIITARDTIIPR